MKNTELDLSVPDGISLKVNLNLSKGLLELRPGAIIEGGNIVIINTGWLISHPVVIADQMITLEPTREVNGVELGVLIIGDLLYESAEHGQDVMQYDSKPIVVIRNGGILQFVVQETKYLLGKTQNVLPWELKVAKVPTRTILRIK